MADRHADAGRGSRLNLGGSFGDALLASVVSLLSTLPALPRLGFYSDDWALLAGFANGGDSLLAWDRVTFPGRPVQAVYLTALYRLFGLHSFGYHLANAGVLAAAAGLFCLLLVRLGCGRAPSLAASALMVLLPQLSTVRVWFAAFQIPLSLLFMLVSMHCQLSAARSRKAIWIAAAVIAAALSIGAYEIFAPLLLGFALALFVRARAASGSRVRALVELAVIAALAAAAFAMKLASGRAGALTDGAHYLHGARKLFRADYDWHVDSGLNLFAAVQAYFVAPVVGWARGALALLLGRTSIEAAVIALLIGSLLCWRLLRIGRTSQPSAGRLLSLGLVALLLGNALFLIVPAVVFTSTGMANRTQVAAALGIAMIFAGLLSLASDAVVRGRAAATAFAVTIALVTAFAAVRMSDVEAYWATASAIEGSVLNAASVDLAALPPRSRVILDGVCPYHGPGIVFETDWDVGGALTLALRRPVAGDTVSPRMSWSRGGLRTSMDGAPSFYPYGPHLYVYDPSRRLLFPLSDAARARRYLAVRRAKTCAGTVQRGADV